MTGVRWVIALLVVLAVVLQEPVVARLPLPGAAPDLVLVVVAAVGLSRGARAGMLTGFAAGLLMDLGSDHALGRLALVHVLVGAAAGLLEDDELGPVVGPLLVGAVLAAGGVLVFAAAGVLVDDARVTGRALLRSLTSTVPYCAALTPVVVPPVAALLRRVDRRT